MHNMLKKDFSELKAKLVAKLLDEQGSHVIMGLAAMLGLMVIAMPFLIDFSSVQFNRRDAQTASDAAALAAAVSYAKSLTLTHEGECGETEAEVVQSYIDEEVIPKGSNGGIGLSAAYEFATDNDAELIKYRVYPRALHSKSPFGVTVPNILVYASAEKVVLTQNNYSSELRTPADASALAYLDFIEVTTESDVCEEEDEDKHFIYFFWSVVLVE